MIGGRFEKLTRRFAVTLRNDKLKFEISTDELKLKVWYVFGETSQCVTIKLKEIFKDIKRKEC